MVSYVVTGASRGIGLGFVRRLSADTNNKVFALVRSPETATQLQEFVSSIDNKNKNVVVLKADLTDYKTIKSAAEEVSKVTGGTLDVLINNGALLHHKRNGLTVDAFPDEEALENDFLIFFRTNVIGVTHTINAFIPLLRNGKTKKVLVVSSSMGSPQFQLEAVYVTCPSYSISKAALNMVVVKFATRFKKEGFTFLAVSPGLIKTMPGLTANELDKIYEEMVAQCRIANPNYPGTVTVEQSVNDQLALLGRVTPEQTGAFLHANGDDANFLTY
ncbi:short-chain dehydrogenases/reductase [Fomitiporia mediterranea MF3/22]|uniref:short-chain dehydrogenases/reductase n=1 Tax=Fomitiporia mediterranea (strain MF3/22) TaxID=694068 RepID=UPI00044098E2|nr:short-chain dehydrogenases/reductase [Fomitiporia mediterranea MF3/22]EJD04868.1 short-chain dehydrogenases/reductase [Fomitiporia mediterranea MF3/22]